MRNTRRNPIDKAFVALTWLVESAPDDVGVREMAIALKVAPSTAHRLCTALTASGLVSRDRRSGRYALAPECFRIAQLALIRAPVRRIALPHLRELVSACDETALLGIYDSNRQEMMFAASVESANVLRYVLELNKWMPIYAGASGLAIMAFLPEVERHSIVERTRLTPLTERTLTVEYRLENELAAIRSRGYALTRGQRIHGAIGLAAPIFNPANEVIGDVCLTIPEQRYEPASEARLAALLKRCTAGISTDLGAIPRALPRFPPSAPEKLPVAAAAPRRKKLLVHD
jgi:DNA-binding IclR family transcriptional regulator